MAKGQQRKTKEAKSSGSSPGRKSLTTDSRLIPEGRSLIAAAFAFAEIL